MRRFRLVGLSTLFVAIAFGGALIAEGSAGWLIAARVTLLFVLIVFSAWIAETLSRRSVPPMAPAVNPPAPLGAMSHQPGPGTSTPAHPLLAGTAVAAMSHALVGHGVAHTLVSSAPRSAPTGEPSPTSAIPPQSTFTGREVDLAALLQLHDELAVTLRASVGEPGELGRPLLLLLHGMPGVGKSALAHELARRLGDRYPDPPLIANLGYAGDPIATGDALRILIEQLRYPPEGIPADTQERASLFRGLTEGRRLIVLLDAVRGAWQVEDLLPNTVNCTMIITSRRDLGPELAVRSYKLDVLSPDDAIEMLYAVTQKEEPDYPMSSSELVEQCGRLPRAIANVGYWVDHDYQDMQDAAAWLRPRANRLTRITRPQPIVIGFAGQYDDLDPIHRKAFCLISLVRTPTFTAQHLADLMPCSLEDAEAYCGELISAQLADVDGTDHAGNPTFRYHPLVRLYAEDRLQAQFLAEAKPARQRLDVAAGLRNEAFVNAMVLPGTHDAAPSADQYRWVLNSLAEIAAGLHHCHASGRQDVLHQVIPLIGGVLSRDSPADLIAVIRLGLAKPPAQPIQEAELYAALGSVYTAAEHYADALAILDTAGRLLTGLPASAADLHAVTYRQAELARLRGQAYAQMRSPNAADEFFLQAQDLFRTIDGPAAQMQLHVLDLLMHLNRNHNLDNIENPIEGYPVSDQFWVHLEQFEEFRNGALWDEAGAQLDLADACCIGDAGRAAQILYRRSRLHLEHSRAATEPARKLLATLAVRRSAEAVHTYAAMDNTIGRVRAMCLLARALIAVKKLDEAGAQLHRAKVFADDHLLVKAGPAMHPLQARLCGVEAELLYARGQEKDARQQAILASILFEDIGDGRNSSKYRDLIP